MRHDFKERLQSFIGGVFSLGFVVLLVFGIARSFHKGVGHGVASILLPPYAWYNGIAVLWEPPAWKVEWDEHTRAVATIMAATIDQNVDNQLAIGHHLDQLHKWAKAMPKEKRDLLRSQTVLFCAEYDNYAKWCIGEILAGRKPGKYPHPVSFDSCPSFNRVWDELQTQQEGDYNLLAESLKTDERKQAFKSNIETFFTMVNANQESRLRSIFE
jgi:hypothetical protein